MARRCSHCNHDGHNSRTCPNHGVRLFGVRLNGGSIQKSASTGNLTIFARSATAAGSPPLDPKEPPVADDVGSGYVSEGFNGGSASRERKKGVPWTEHEHKMFLLGLKKLGKGDWRGIARNYVLSRTPTQVASHAQKYFIRHSATKRRKRRVSLFDIVSDEVRTLQTTVADNLSSSSWEQEVQGSSFLPVPQVSEEQADMKDCSTTEVEETLSAPPTAMKYIYPPPVYPVFFPLPVPLVLDEHADTKDDITAEVEGAVPLPPETMQYSYPAVYPGFFSPGFPCPIPYWPGFVAPAAVLQSHEIVKPMAVYSKNPINVAELLGMSRLSLGECNGEAGPLMPRPKLVGDSKRQSAFHTGKSPVGSRLDSSSSPIHAI